MVDGADCCCVCHLVKMKLWWGHVESVLNLKLLAGGCLKVSVPSKYGNLLQCSDTVVVFSKRIEPAWKSDIKSESFL
jgi:hypothetical protein